MRTAIVAILLAVAVILGTPSSGYAVEPDEVLPDPALEHRARRLSAELRCMVCQNQSIDDSDAPLAHDIRVLLRERLAAGDSDRQVMDYLVARYGDFVLLKPPLRPYTLILWITPVLVLLGAAGFTIARLRAQRPASVTALTEAERAELARIEGADESADGPITKA